MSNKMARERAEVFKSMGEIGARYAAKQSVKAKPEAMPKVAPKSAQQTKRWRIDWALVAVVTVFAAAIVAHSLSH